MFQVSRSSIGAIVAALLLVAVGITTWQLLLLEAKPASSPTTPAEPVSITQASNNLDGLALDPTIHEVVLHIRNPGSQPVRVIGLQGGCHGNCCFRAKPSMTLPFDIPPGGKADFITELRVYSPGPFEAPMVVFVDQGGLRELPITVTGTGANKETTAYKNAP